MQAQVIREDRLGIPTKAFQIEQIPVPEILPDECLVLVMAAGINFAGVWAAAGSPLNIIQLHRKEGDLGGFHIGGSDASGIVYRVGASVQGVTVGDSVVLHGGFWEPNDPFITAGGDPILAPSTKMWGYEVNYGSFAQFARVKGHQVLKKPPHLSWEEAAAYMGMGGSAYRALYGFPEHSLRANDVVLIWGAAGGFGSMATQLCALAGAIPVAVVSTEARGEYCRKLGAKGIVNRSQFDHWGMLPHWSHAQEYAAWLKGARAFGKAIWDSIGEKRNPRLVLEHPGEATLPTSCFVCETGGMVVICGGTTGYNGTLDLRHHWVRQKRLQGTHFANLNQVHALNDLVISKKLDPCLSRTFRFEEIGLAHQLLVDNQHPCGNMAALVGASTTGLGRS